MKPYTLTLTIEEVGILDRALRGGLFSAKQQASIQVIGAADIVRQIDAALQLMKRPFEGGYETDEECHGAFIKRFAADCAVHGSD